MTGFCMGWGAHAPFGGERPDADASVVGHGSPPLEYVDAPRIKAPLMRRWATEDTVLPIAKVDELEEKLRNAHAKFEFHRYHAKHAFANETADSKKLPYLKHVAVAGALACRRTMDFLAKHIK